MSHSGWKSHVLVVVGLVLAGLFLVAWNGPTPPEPPTSISAQGATATPAAGPTATPAEGAVLQMPARVRREIDIVVVGEDGLDPITLPDGAWRELPEGGWLTTDENGEGWVEIGGCEKIYVFQDSGLRKEACSRSDLLAGSATCSEGGTAVFDNDCASQIIIQTGSAQFVPLGSWFAVTYLPERQLSLVMVFEGQARTQPVLDADDYTLGDVVDVAPEQFWFTTSGATSESVAGLNGREPQPFEQLMPVVEELDMWRWMPRIEERAAIDGIPYPDFPPFVCGPPDYWTGYVVQANDTLFSLAAETGTSVEGIRWANCLEEDTLVVGQSLFLPSLPPPDTPTPTNTPTAIPTATPTPTDTPIPPTTDEPPVTETPAADLRIDKRGPAEAVRVNQPYSYTVTVTNDGPFAAQNVSVFDSLPAGVMESVSTAGCNNDSGGVPICELGTIAAGSFRSFTINLTATGTLETITNNASVGSSTQDPNPENNATSVSTEVIPDFDLEIRKKDSADPVSPNQPYSYAITVTNRGPSTARGVTVTDTLPDDVTVDRDDERCVYTDNGRVVICELGTIVAHSSRSFAINVTAPGRGLIDLVAPCRERVITNTARVTAELGDEDYDATEEPTTIVFCPPDLAIEKTGPDYPVYVNDEYSYEITVTNMGRSEAQRVTVTDTLPPGVAFYFTEGCENDSRGIPDCALGPISPGESKFYVINVRAPDSPGTITNTVSVTSSAGDRNPENNRTEVPTEIIERYPELVISKDNGTDKTVRGTSTTYTIVVNNVGNADAIGATVTDFFLGALTNVEWTCEASAGARCTTSGRDRLNEKVDIPVGGAVTYTVHADVQQCVTGNLVNMASVNAPAGVIEANTDNNSDTDRDRLPFEPNIRNTLLWIAQILLAIAFLMSGVMKAMGLRLGKPALATAVSTWNIAQTPLIGLLEILGAIGLIVPALTCIMPRLTSLAAGGLALLTVGAIIVQAGRTRRNWTGIVIAVVLLLLAIFVAFGRLVWIPVHCACS